MMSAFSLFEDHGIYQKSEPEPLQEMEDESFFAVQETETEEVSIRPVNESPCKERYTSVRQSQPPAPLNWTTQQAGTNLPGANLLDRKFLRFQFRPAAVSKSPSAERRGDDIDVVAFESSHAPINKKVLIVQTIFTMA